MSRAVYEYMQKDFPNTLWCCQSCCKEVRSTFPSIRKKEEGPETGSASKEYGTSSMETRMDGVEVKLTGMEKMLQRVCKFIGSPNVPRTAGEFNLPVAPQATTMTTEERGQMKEGSATSTSTVWKIAPESNSPPSFRSGVPNLFQAMSRITKCDGQ
jgi:hypothetical protein